MISVIIPVYNAEQKIERCIKSLLMQNVQDKEYIFVNDGSNDGSLSILKYYEQKYAEITVVDKENGGVSSARNAGIRMSKGEYITFIDSDDYYISQDYLSDMLQIINEHPGVDLVVAGYTMLMEKGQKREIKEFGNIDIKRLAEDYVNYREIMSSPWNKLFRKEKSVHEFNESMKMGEDAVFVLDYLMNCNQISFCSNCGYGYEFINNSTTADYRKSVPYDIMQTEIYHSAIKELWNKVLDEEKAADMYIRLRTDAIYTMVSNVLYKKGIKEYVLYNISDLFDDDFLKENFHLLGKGYARCKLTKLIIKKSHLLVKVYVLKNIIYEKIRGKLKAI